MNLETLRDIKNQKNLLPAPLLTDLISAATSGIDSAVISKGDYHNTQDIILTLELLGYSVMYFRESDSIKAYYIVSGW